MSMFQKATKRAVKARVALDGPTGSGKTWTALVWAQVLGKRTAVVDTERGSASLYSDRFDFDVLEMTPPYEPKRLVEALNAAEADGYDVVIVDSLSHFWEGEGGTLDIADAAGERAKGNSFAGWKIATPELRHLVDVMLGLDAHLIVTMRSKMEWVLEEDARGKKVPRKIGLAPVMRQGIDYEFQLVGDLDYEHRLSISKSRSDLLADQMYGPGRAQEGAETFARWLDAGEPVASRNDTDALVARMNRLPDDVRSACKNGFVEHFGRPAGLLASKLADATAYIAGFEGDDPAGAVNDTTTPDPGDGGGEDDVTPAPPVETPPAPPVPPTLTDRINALPRDLAELVRSDQQKVLDSGVASRSAEHVAAVEASLADAEKAQAKRAKDTAIAVNAGAKTAWGRDVSDEERHQLLQVFTDGDVSSAKKVTADQLKAIKRQVRDWQNGSLVVDNSGEVLSVRAAAVAS